MRIAVLGLGGAGSAAARFLAADGCAVTGFEQFPLDHDRGSSYGGSRIIRHVYPDALYAGLMGAAYPLWEALEAESGGRLFLRCGGFFFGPEGHPEMTAVEEALAEVGVPHQRWSAAEARERLPPFRLDAGEYAVFEANSGLLRASRCVLANCRGARARGAELREGTAVFALEPAPEGIRIRSAAGTELFDRVVVAAGAWVAPLLAPWVRLPLTVTRQQYVHFEVGGDRALFAPGRFPIWIDMESEFYGFPEHDEIPGAKVAWNGTGPVFDPERLDREPDPAEDSLLREYVRRRLPALDGPVTYRKVCLYTSTPDHDFIVDRLPGEPRILLLSACSGHGFKFTVLMGRIAASLAQDRVPGYDLARFSLARFPGVAP